jgi:replication factor A1
LPRSFSFSRGRSRGETRIYVEPLLSIVKIAAKNGIDPRIFIDTFFEAYKSGDDLCEDLRVTCRGVNEDSAIFLVTKKEKVISQFPIKIKALENQNTFKNHIQHIPLSSISKNKEQNKKKIGTLRYRMKGVDLKAEIVEIPPVRNVITRFGSVAKVTNIKIADETGSIRLSLWNKQTDNIHVGDKIDIKNSYVARYGGEPQLRLGRKGSVSILEEDSVSILD